MLILDMKLANYLKALNLELKKEMWEVRNKV